MTPADALREAATMARKRGLAHDDRAKAVPASARLEFLACLSKAAEAHAIADELEKMAAEAVRSTP